MVVWGFPCESKSSPAHYSKHPGLERGRGVSLWKIKLIGLEGNPTEIQKNLESWLPLKSTGLTYKKEIYRRARFY